MSDETKATIEIIEHYWQKGGFYNDIPVEIMNTIINELEEKDKEIERLKTELQDTKEHLGEYLHEQEEENKRLNNIIHGLQQYIIERENDNNKLYKSKITSQAGKDKILIENIIYDDIFDKIKKLKEENK